MQTPSRRTFLTCSLRSLAAIGAASVAGRLSQVGALAATSCPTDYKALVCVFLFGGNDATGWGGRGEDAMKGCNYRNSPTISGGGGNALFAGGSQAGPATVVGGQALGLQGFVQNNAASTARLPALQNLLNFDNGLTL